MRLPYRLAISAFIAAFRRRPEIEAICVRNGFARGDWRPGLSDIDFIVVVRRGMTAEHEFAFLQAFWRTHARLKAVFPMISETVVTDEAPWGSKLLSGRMAGVADRPSRSDEFCEALWFYLDGFAGLLAPADSFLGRQDRLRVARKVMRLLDRDPEAVHPRMGPADLHAFVLDALHQAAGPQPAVPEIAGGPFMGPFLAPRGEGIRSVLFTSDGRPYVIYDAAQTAETIATSMHVNRARWERWRYQPTHLTERLFIYVARELEPVTYSPWRRSMSVGYGVDLLAGVPPPEAPHIIAWAERMSARASDDRRGSALAAPRNTAALRRNAERLMIRRLPAAELCDGHSTLRERCRAHYPATYAALERVEDCLRTGDAAGARWRAFKLLYDLSSTEGPSARHALEWQAGVLSSS